VWLEDWTACWFDITPKVQFNITPNHQALTAQALPVWRLTCILRHLASGAAMQSPCQSIFLAMPCAHSLHS